ncbi:phosphatase PAP2 family protein [Flavihumibacter rivuli]|uniref:vanadium-dependent haloperoxidase n=1 Tax=Flavihumibacter rivuli TaxID=2838156 RepID=UPI001BDEE243|nr:vanadium-dependent haloperoxidase [Flavihumibacter rivuli]ULQ57771.1 phosphatase PAP2 family protein [Flavihumibacter rivuli]
MQVKMHYGKGPKKCQFPFNNLFMVSFLVIGFMIMGTACQKPAEPLVTPEEVQAIAQKDNNGWHSPDVVMAWNNAIQTAYTYPVGVGFPPPIISRFFAMYHVAMHDALNNIKPKYATYAYHQRDKDADPDAAVAQAVHDVLKQIGPQGAGFQPFTNLLSGTLAAIPDGDAKTRGIALGKAVAAALLAKRSADAPFLNLNYPTAPPNGDEPGEYRYLPPFNTFALAGFHLQQTWVIPSGDYFRPGPPYAINSDEYTNDYNEVKDYGSLNSTARSPEQSEIGVFWAENSSRGWNSITRDIILKRPGKSMDAWKTARLLALVHMAIADGYINVFDTKIHYNYWRPISAIRLGESDGNPNTSGDPNWTPVLLTPAVGEYSSAHALTGAAAGRVLMRFFGTDRLPFTTNSGYWPTPRSYSSMATAIRDNSLSRIYIGYHFRKAVDEGQKTGYQLGDYVYEHGLAEQ